MKQPLHIRSAAEGAAPKPLVISELGAPPSAHERQVAIDAILSGPPSVLMFRHYWWLTGRPVPLRRNLQTNDEYTSRHFWRLRRAAEEYRLKVISSDIAAKLDAVSDQLKDLT